MISYDFNQAYVFHKLKLVLVNVTLGGKDKADGAIRVVKVNL
jgi:hypothetical protein